MIWCVLPLKSAALAKQRLAYYLSSEERSGLVKAMAEDVILSVLNSRVIENILIASTETYAAQLAQKYQLQLLSSGLDNNLNSAITHAADYLQHKAVSTMLVIHGDLPQIVPTDIRRIIDNHINLVKSQQNAITIVPDAAGKGSNILCCTPPTAIPFRFGPNSCEQHQALAQGLQVAQQICPTDSAAYDIDYPEDLITLMRDFDDNAQHGRKQNGAITQSYLQKSGIAEKLKPLLLKPSTNDHASLHTGQSPFRNSSRATNTAASASRSVQTSVNRSVINE